MTLALDLLLLTVDYSPQSCGNVPAANGCTPQQRRERTARPVALGVPGQALPSSVWALAAERDPEASAPDSLDRF